MGQVLRQSDEYNLSDKQKAWAMVAIFSVYGTMAYFLQTLTIARPKIAAGLDGMALYSWSVSIPSLFSAFVTLLFGKFSDMYGRRIMLLISMICCLVGTILSAISTTFIFLIAASVITAIGTGAMMPLVFAVVGDVFPPSQRSKWIGLLNIPIGFFALIGPPMGGWVVDNMNWRYLFLLPLPLVVLCLVTIPIGVPSMIQRGVTRKIDYRGCLLVAVASSAMILGLSFAGTTYPWASVQVIGLLAVSLIFWVAFFKTESSTEEPVLDPLVFRNRSFLTISIANSLSFFGQMAIMMYFPMFLQGVQGISTTNSGWVTVPYSVLMSFVGVPVGFILARSQRYKWMYVAGFGLLTLDMFAIVFFNANTPIVFSVLAAVVAGVSLGAVPTVNTLVIQNVMPKRLLGAAMGASFFCLLMSVAIAPAVLGSTMTVAYDKSLKNSLPDGLKRFADETTMASVMNQRVLLSDSALKDLEKSFGQMDPAGQALFPQTVAAIRSALQSSLKSVFLFGAITMLLAFLLISTIPEVSLDNGDF
jgi:MFS family permease